jgi:hypothetical protein
MVRSFSPEPLDPAAVDAVVQAALRAPTAGNTGGTAWVVLEGEAQTSAYWAATTDEAWRSASPRWEGLRRAPVILLAYASAEAYLARYGEADKAGSELGGGEDAWAVPYWTGDAAFGVMSVLLAAVDGGLGVPAGWRLFGAVLLGHPDGRDHRSPSLDRAGPDPAARVHRGTW